MKHPHQWRDHRRAHTGVLLSSAALAAVVLGWGVLAMGSDIEEDKELRVEIVRQGQVHPYTRISHTLRVERGMGTIAVTRDLPGDHGQERRVSLLPADALASALNGLTECGLRQLPRGKRRVRAAQTWEIDVMEGTKRRRIKVPEPVAKADGRYGRCLEVLKALSIEHAGYVPFADERYPQKEMGFLELDSVPPAKVHLNGQPTGHTTPVSALPLREGKHELTLKDGVSGLERTYQIKIVGGMTTHVDLDLN